MDKEDSKPSNPATTKESFPSGKYPQQHGSDEQEPNPTEEDSYDEFQDKLNTIGRRICRCWRRSVKKGWRQTKFHDQLNVILAAGGLLFLMAYTILTYNLWQETRTQTQLSTRTAYWEHGAKFTICNMELRPDKSEDVRYVISVANVGKGNAANVRILVREKFSGTEPDNTEDSSNRAESVDDESDITRPVSVPSGDCPKYFDLRNVGSPTIGYKNGSERLYIYGTVWYEDAIPGEHWKQFCAYFLPVGQFNPAYPNAKVSYSFCKSHIGGRYQTGN